MQERRSSLGMKKNRVRIMEQVLERFVSRQFLASNSLFHNLFSSEELTVDLAGQELLTVAFGTRTLREKELYEFAYFHQRDKKLLLYAFLLHFLTKTAKFELVLVLNREGLDCEELREFLGEAWEPFLKRVTVFQHRELTAFVFNLQWLSQLCREREFLRGVVICDVNAFESSDKSSAEKYYRRLPRDFFALSFRRDFYEYKIFQKSSLSYISDQQDLREMYDQLAHNLHKKLDFFAYKPALIAPLEYVYPNLCKTI